MGEISETRPLPQPQDLAGSPVVESLSCLHPEPSWPPGHSGSPFPLGKLLEGLSNPSQAALPAPATMLNESLGGQRVHSPRSLGRAGRGAWQAALAAGAWPSGPNAFVPFPAT